jgi:hypothetical protein
MVSIEPCDKHEIINCSVCHKPPVPLRIKVGRGGGKFSSASTGRLQAKFPGFCYQCHAPIDVGDPITRSFDDEGWVCEDCAE